MIFPQEEDGNPGRQILPLREVLFITTRGVSGIWRGNTKFWETKMGEHKKFPLKEGEQKIFIKRNF